MLIKDYASSTDHRKNSQLKWPKREPRQVKSLKRGLHNYCAATISSSDATISNILSLRLENIMFPALTTAKIASWSNLSGNLARWSTLSWSFPNYCAAAISLSDATLSKIPTLRVEYIMFPTWTTAKTASWSDPGGNLARWSTLSCFIS